MASAESIARISPMPIPQSSVAQLARTLAQCRRDLPPSGSLTALPADQQTELKAVARLMLDPLAFSNLRLDMDLRLRKALAQHIHGTTFERLHDDDRAELVTEAQVVIGVVLRVLAGDLDPLPSWERDCLLGRDEAGLDGQEGQ